MVVGFESKIFVIFPMISIANKIRTGMVHINYAPVDQKAPFGGYKKSGNGREWGLFGFEEFLEVKAVVGFTG